MKGKIVFITGATSGIGKATAIGLAKMGATVHFHGRNESLAKSVKQEIDAVSGHSLSRYFIADLGSQASIRQMSIAIHEQLPSIDVLINNAGGVYQSFELSEDGIEKTMAINHFAYFLLTDLLLDLLKKSPTGRIVNVASKSNLRGKINFDSFTQNKGYFIMSAYEQSKLANVLFTKALARRLKGTGVTTNCLHPGVVKTAIGKKDTAWISSFFWTLMSKLVGITVEDGARTSIYLASSPEVDNISGEYFDLCKVAKANKLAHDQDLQEALWKKSLELCPLD